MNKKINPNGIRINTGAMKIQVNDEGDFITLQLGDEGFVDNFFNLVKGFETASNELLPKFKEIDQEEETFDSMGLPLKMAKIAKLNADFHREIKTKVDGLFGEGSCNKLFGNILPSAEAYASFFQQLEPYFEEHAKKRAQTMNKYSANRQGNV